MNKNMNLKIIQTYLNHLDIIINDTIKLRDKISSLIQGNCLPNEIKRLEKIIDLISCEYDLVVQTIIKQCQDMLKTTNHE
jgi:hypothetical protein